MRTAMRKVLGGVVAALVLLGTVVVLEAGPASSRTVAAKKSGLETARGVVTEVSHSALVMAAEAKSAAAEMRFVLDERTVVLKGRKRVEVAEIRAGDPVTVSYAQNGGSALAKRIWVRAQAKGADGGARPAKEAARP